MAAPGTGKQAGAEPPSAGGERPRPAGLSPPQEAAAEALGRLATVVRAFTSLDARRDPDRALLQEGLDALTAALAPGDLVVDVSRSELSSDGAVLYGNDDPESSLAGCLDRDGVRRLTFRQGLPGEEFLGLVEALSTRFTRLEPREDDLVTLWRSSGFKYVGLQWDPARLPAPQDGQAAGLGDELELPHPDLPIPAAPKWVALTTERLHALRAEAAPARLASDCLSLARHLRTALADPQAQLTFGALGQVFGELRDYLLHEERLDELQGFVRLLREMVEELAPPWDPGRISALRSLLASLGAKRQVRRLLRSLSREQRRAPESVVAALDQLCADPLAAVASVLPDERHPGVRVAARQVLECYGRTRGADLQQRFLSARGQLASDLLRAIAGQGDEAAIAFVVQQSAHPDEAVQDEALFHLSRMPYSTGVGRALLAAFRQTSRERRARILELIVRTRDGRFVDLLARHVEEHAPQLTPDEAAGIGRAVGSLAGEASIGRWRTWLQPRPDGQPGFEGPLARQVAALLALAEIPGEDAAEALGEAFDQAGDEAQPWVLGALAQRQRSSSRKAT